MPPFCFAGSYLILRSTTPDEILNGQYEMIQTLDRWGNWRTDTPLNVTEIGSTLG
jgi:hypothetical protein